MLKNTIFSFEIECLPLCFERYFTEIGVKFLLKGGLYQKWGIMQENLKATRNGSIRGVMKERLCRDLKANINITTT